MRLTHAASAAILAVLLGFGSANAQAPKDQSMKDMKMSGGAMEHAGHEMAPAHKGDPTTSITVSPSSGLIVGKKTDFTVTVKSKDGTPVTLNDLKEAHTKKIHLLIIDPSLTDYHHEHPVAGSAPGTYTFSFEPKMGGEYKIFADLVPAATSEQEYAATTVTVAGPASPVVKKTNTETTTDGYKVAISFEKPELTSGDANMMTLNVTGPDGKPFTNLEPIMGAYAHLVAFSEDRDTVAHVHPMGDEPKKDSDRGGPSLGFHLMFPEPGYQKLFAQFQIGGKNVFAPFGLDVKPGKGGTEAAVKEHGHADGKVEIPATVDGIFDEVTEHLGELDKVVASGKLDGVHEIAFDIRDMLLALPGKAKALSAENQKALGTSLSKIKQEAALLDKFGDAGDAAQTKAVLAKYKTEIETIKKLIGGKESSDAGAATEIKLVNNKLCPITGEPVGSMEKGAHLDYKGYRVGLCCMGYAKKFLKDGDANLAKATAKQ